MSGQAGTTAQPGTLDLHLPAAAAALAGMRQAVRAWLRELGIGNHEASELLLVCNEACSNAIEHGSAEGGRNEVHLKGRVVDGVLRVEVRDHGRWHYKAPATGRGQGLRIVRRVMDHVAIRRYADGTDLVMFKRIDREREAPAIEAAPES